MSHLFQPPISSDPYESESSSSAASGEDEEKVLLSQINDAHTLTPQHHPNQPILPHNHQSSTPSYIAQQRQSFVIPPKPSYTKSRRALNKLLKAQHDVEMIEDQLEDERRRGRCLLLACLFMTIFCSFLFADRWPEDWRGALIELLEKDRNQDPESTGVDGEKVSTGDPLQDFRNKEKDRTKVSNDDDDHYSRYGDAYERYKETYKKKNKVKNLSDSKVEKPKKPTEKELIEENEKQHIDNLSKFLKWNLPYKDDRDVPVFWHIPLTGTLLIDEILGQCYSLIQAADDARVFEGHEDDGILKVISANDKRYINVDLGTVSGIIKAKELHLARSGAVELIRTSYLYEAAILFENNANYGKCFTMIRDPVERSIDVFYKLKKFSNNMVFKSMNLDEYVNLPYVEDNWMVRVLSNELEGELKKEHLELSKQILGRKFIVGLAEEFEESMRRFVKYFRWDEKASTEEVDKCKEKLKVTDHINSGNFTEATHTRGQKPKEEIYGVLHQKNKFHIELYQ